LCSYHEYELVKVTQVSSSSFFQHFFIELQCFLLGPSFDSLIFFYLDLISQVFSLSN
jgi:hypothetical protein